ncbi:hypothetical protein [Nostoc sp.]
MGSGEEAFSWCTDFFQKSNTSPIEGFFDDEDALHFEINFITSDGLELAVDAMLDMGL